MIDDDDESDPFVEAAMRERYANPALHGETLVEIERELKGMIAALNSAGIEDLQQTLTTGFNRLGDIASAQHEELQQVRQQLAMVKVAAVGVLCILLLGLFF